MKERREIFTDCTLCYHSCGCRVTVEDGKAVKVEGLESHPLNRGALCPKGLSALENIYSPKRLKYPMKRMNGGFERITWEQALDEIAGKLNSLRDRFGPQVLGDRQPWRSLAVRTYHAGRACRPIGDRYGDRKAMRIERVTSCEFKWRLGWRAVAESQPRMRG